MVATFRYFGGFTVAVGDDKKRVQVTLSSDLVDQLDEHARRIGVSKSALASVAVADWLQAHSNDAPDQGQPEDSATN